MALTISIFSDVICPWCYVGKRRLEAALDELGLRTDTRITWLPFELNPDMPEAGIPRSEYRARKFGAPRGAELDAQMVEIGREEGIAFAFDRVERTPSTRRAHMLIAYAHDEGLGDPVASALFRAYFEDGRDIGDPAVLTEIAAAAGLDPVRVGEALGDEALRQRVVATEQQAYTMGVSGVPFSIVDERWAVSGAQPKAEWVQALRTRVPSIAA